MDGSNVYERMKAGWTVTVTSTSLTVLQIQAPLFMDIVDQAFNKRLFNEAAFRNSYYAGRAGLQLDLPLVTGLKPKSRRVRRGFRLETWVRAKVRVRVRVRVRVG